MKREWLHSTLFGRGRNESRAPVDSARSVSQGKSIVSNLLMKVSGRRSSSSGPTASESPLKFYQTMNGVGVDYCNLSGLGSWTTTINLKGVNFAIDRFCHWTASSAIILDSLATH